MKTSYLVFLKKSGLTSTRYLTFLVMKMKQVMPNADTDASIEFIDNLATEARK